MLHLSWLLEAGFRAVGPPNARVAAYHPANIGGATQLHPSRDAPYSGALTARALRPPGPQTFDEFLEGWRSRGLAGTPCTSVWTVGAIAYRCRTCQARLPWRSGLSCGC